MNEDIIIYDPFKLLKEFADIIEKEKEVNNNGLRTQADQMREL